MGLVDSIQFVVCTSFTTPHQTDAAPLHRHCHRLAATTRPKITLPPPLMTALTRAHSFIRTALPSTPEIFVIVVWYKRLAS
ncbi:hypothetical protein BKA81DRAFT_15805 [Phyllosticta paracitricarpa]